MVVKLKNHFASDSGPLEKCTLCPGAFHMCETREQDRGHTRDSWRHFSLVNALKKRSHCPSLRLGDRSGCIIQQAPIGVLGLDRDAYVCRRHVEQANTQRVGQRCQVKWFCQAVCQHRRMHVH